MTPKDRIPHLTVEMFKRELARREALSAIEATWETLSERDFRQSLPNLTDAELNALHDRQVALLTPLERLEYAQEWEDRTRKHRQARQEKEAEQEGNPT